MGLKCIAAGCKSGYDSTVKKFHMFLVPKNPAVIEQWQKAISRDDIVLKHKHAVCEKHFFKSDIVWGAEVRGPDGKVMSAIKYKIPRLRAGALPKIIPNSSNNSSPKQRKRKSSKKGNEPENAETKISTSDELNPDVANTLNHIKIKDNEIVERNDMKVNFFFANSSPPENVLFETIFEDSKSVQFPTSWARHNITFEDSKIIQFSQWTAKFVKDSIEPVLSKQIVLKENMKIWIAIFGKPIELKEIATESSLLSVESVEKILDIVDKWELCRGFGNSEEDEFCDDMITHRDKEDFLRHNQCSYVLSLEEFGTDKKMCEACYSATEIISRKKAKLEQVETLENAKRIKVSNLNAAQKKRRSFLKR